MEIAFHDKNGNTGGTITADKSVTAANIILKDELLKTTTLTDVVKYNVYDYKLTVMYYNGHLHLFPFCKKLLVW